MESSVAARRRYAKRREPKTPPHVSLKILRVALKLRLDDVADRVEHQTGDRPTKGALSAIENGHRGASAEMLAAIEEAFGLPVGSITTTYEPRPSLAIAEDVPA